jgi:hypothetical protein
MKTESRKWGLSHRKNEAVTAGVPIEDGEKYETQRGFLWTNGVYLYSLTNDLGTPLTF